jgi:hypothetical protein
MAVYKTFIQGYKAKMAITAPAVAEVFFATLKIAERAEDVDTSESGPDGFTDQVTGMRGADLDVTCYLQTAAAVATLIATLKPGAELEGVDVFIDRASANKFGFPFLLVLSGELPVEVKAGVWKLDWKAKTRGPYTRPATVA